jgi:hypothetical protein
MVVAEGVTRLMLTDNDCTGLINPRHQLRIHHVGLAEKVMRFTNSVGVPPLAKIDRLLSEPPRSW